MAASEYIELQGNESILRAVEYLRMLPEWKAKPGKLRSGFCEFAEVISRHLVELYCQLEGKPCEEKLELSEMLNPLRDERLAEDRLQMVIGSLKAYEAKLNAWHLLFSSVGELSSYLLTELDGEGWQNAAAHLCIDRLSGLVDDFPFPKIEV